MIADYNQMDWTANPAFKGGDGVYFNKTFTDGVNKMMLGKLEPGSSIGFHKHEGNCEIMFFVEGEGKVIYDDGEEEVKPGYCHYCPEGHSHSLINNGTKDLIFYAAVTVQ